MHVDILCKSIMLHRADIFSKRHDIDVNVSLPLQYGGTDTKNEQCLESCSGKFVFIYLFIRFI